MQVAAQSGAGHGFPLPADALPDGEAWHPRTVAWWETWRDSPQAQAMLATDWDALLDTALLHHLLWSRHQMPLAAEIRLRVAKFGATLEDRARLRMKVTVPAPDPAESPAAVSNLADRRARLSG